MQANRQTSEVKLSGIPSAFEEPVKKRNVKRVVKICTSKVWDYLMGLFAKALLLVNTRLRRKLGQNSPPKQSHNAVRHNTDPVSNETSKEPIRCAFATSETRRELGRFNLRKDTWDC